MKRLLIWMTVLPGTHTVQWQVIKIDSRDHAGSCLYKEFGIEVQGSRALAENDGKIYNTIRWYSPVSKIGGE